ncbi:hypothetical protein AOLI_G00143400 [Acnodon oligacanthus]
MISNSTFPSGAALLPFRMAVRCVLEEAQGWSGVVQSPPLSAHPPPIHTDPSPGFRGAPRRRLATFELLAFPSSSRWMSWEYRVVRVFGGIFNETVPPLIYGMYISVPWRGVCERGQDVGDWEIGIDTLRLRFPLLPAPWKSEKSDVTVTDSGSWH